VEGIVTRRKWDKTASFNPLSHGRAVTAFSASLRSVLNGLHRRPAPLSGVSASRWGEGLQWRTQLSLQTLLNVPHWGTATALTRSRLSTRSLLDVCHRHTATEPTGETADANRSQLSLRSLLGVPHRGTATEPTGEKGKKLVLIISPLNSNLPN